MVFIKSSRLVSLQLGLQPGFPMNISYMILKIHHLNIFNHSQNTGCRCIQVSKFDCCVRVYRDGVMLSTLADLMSPLISTREQTYTTKTIFSYNCPLAVPVFFLP